MKQKIYIQGLVTVLIIFTGVIFKVNHWPLAGILLIVGISAFVLLFLPVALMNCYRGEGNSQNRTLYIVAFLTCFIVFTSMLFKIQQWPYAAILLTIALPFPYVVFLPAFLRTTSKNRNFNIYNTVIVLFLLVYNSVFSALLALNVSKERVDESYNLSRSYNKTEMSLDRLPAGDSESTVSLKIDEVLKIVDEYQYLILKEEGISVENWETEPGSLWRPESNQVAALALSQAGDQSGGTKLWNGLEELVREIEKTPGYENLANAAPAIFDLKLNGGENPVSNNRPFEFNNLAWSLIYLDGLETNLKMIKASVNM